MGWATCASLYCLLLICVVELEVSSRKLGSNYLMWLRELDISYIVEAFVYVMIKNENHPLTIHVHSFSVNIGFVKGGLQMTVYDIKLKSILR